MNPPPNFRWLVGLCARLLLIGVGTVVVLLLLLFLFGKVIEPLEAGPGGPVRQTLRICLQVGLALLVMGFGVVCAWAIQRGLPFFRTHTPSQRWLVAAGAAASLVAVLGLLLSLVWRQVWVSTHRAEFQSPADPAFELRFYDEEWQGRTLDLWVRVSGEREHYVTGFFGGEDAPEGWPRLRIQWTKDGQAVVCLQQSPDGGGDSRPLVAYDFKADQAFITPGIEPHRVLSDGALVLDGIAAAATIGELAPLIARHGGLGAEVIDERRIRAAERNLWFWQVPAPAQ